MAEHTLKAYDRALDALRRDLVALGQAALSMATEAARAFATADVGLAQEVAAESRQFPALRRRVEDEAVLTIARQAPVASDLREIIAAIRIAGDLARVARHAGAIADEAVRIGSSGRVPAAIAGCTPLAALAIELLAGALASYADRDAERARVVWERDAELDALEGVARKDLVAGMIADPRAIGASSRVLAAARSIERIGDHAANIAELVIQLVTGVSLPDERPHGVDAGLVREDR